MMATASPGRTSVWSSTLGGGAVAGMPGPVQGSRVFPPGGGGPQPCLGEALMGGSPGLPGLG